MSAFKKKILACSLAAVLMFAFVGCTLPQQDDVFTINFYVNGEIFYSAETDGDTIELRSVNYQTDDFEFIGWFFDDGIWREPFSFSTAIQKNQKEVNLYARMRPLIDDETSGDINAAQLIDNSVTHYNEIMTVSDGYIAVGGSYYPHYNGVIVKYNRQEEIVWEKAFGGSEWDEFWNVIEIEDGYIVHALCASNDGNLAGLKKGTRGRKTSVTVKYNKDGTLAWAKELSLNDFIANDDGFVAVGGICTRSGKDFDTFFVAQFNTDGKLMWKKTIINDIAYYDGYETVSLLKIFNAPDGYYLYGSASQAVWFSIVQGPHFMLSIDGGGNINWQKEFKINDIEVITVTDKGIFVAGVVQKYNNELILGPFPEGTVITDDVQRYDLEMNLLMEASYDGTRFTDIFTIDTNVYVTGMQGGYFDRYSYSLKGVIVGFDERGDKFFEDEMDYVYYNIFPTNEGFAVCGSKGPFTFYDSSYVV